MSLPWAVGKRVLLVHDYDLKRDLRQQIERIAGFSALMVSLALMSRAVKCFLEVEESSDLTLGDVSELVQILRAGP